MKDLDEALRNFEGDPVEAWHRFQPDLLMQMDVKNFVLSEYDQAEKTIHVDYGNLIVMTVKLGNGFIIVEHCICMNPKEFDLTKGIEICKEKVLNKLLEIYNPVEIKNPKNLKKFRVKSR